MKQKLYSILLLLVAMLCIGANSASAQTNSVITYTATSQLSVYQDFFDANNERVSFTHDFDASSEAGTVTFNGVVTRIGDNAFKNCTALTSITLPDSVTGIGNNAFSGCSALTTITLPDNVTSIGTSAFNGCSGLTSFTISNTVTDIGNRAFSGCSALTAPLHNATLFAYMPPSYTGSYTIPDGITTICGGAFFYCTSLTTITLPSSLESIGNNAFSGCSGLTSITLPDNVTSIGNGAFYGCSSITSPVYNATLFAYMPPSSTGSYTIPDGITTICGGAFNGCSGLSSITLPNTVTGIGTSAFNGCSGITSLDLSNLNTSDMTDMSYLFSDCSNLTSLNLSGLNTSNVTNMSYLFSGCSNLTSLDLSSFNTSKVTSMTYMFDSCTRLTSLNMSGLNTSSVTNMCNMFVGCSSLTSLDLSGFNTSNVTDLNYMFDGCSGLTSLDLSGFNTSSVKNMSYMFVGCSSLTSLIVGEEWEMSGDLDCRGMFSGCDNLIDYYKTMDYFAIRYNETIISPDFGDIGAIMWAIGQAHSIDSDNANDIINFFKSENPAILRAYKEAIDTKGSPMSVTYTIRGNRYGTIILPVNWTKPVNWTVYSCTGTHSGAGEDAGHTVVTLTKVDSPVKNTPYIVRTSNGEAETFLFIGGENGAGSDIHSDGILTGVLAGGGATIPTGSYVLASNNSTGQAFYLTNGTVTCPQYKCYLTLAAASGEAPARIDFVTDQGIATPVEFVVADDCANGKATKRLENGHLVIRKDGHSFTATGQLIY